MRTSGNTTCIALFFIYVLSFFSSCCINHIIVNASSSSSSKSGYNNDYQGDIIAIQIQPPSRIITSMKEKDSNNNNNEQKKGLQFGKRILKNEGGKGKGKKGDKSKHHHHHHHHHDADEWWHSPSSKGKGNRRNDEHDDWWPSSRGRKGSKGKGKKGGSHVDHSHYDHDADDWWHSSSSKGKGKQGKGEKKLDDEWWPSSKGRKGKKGRGGNKHNGKSNNRHDDEWKPNSTGRKGKKGGKGGKKGDRHETDDWYYRPSKGKGKGRGGKNGYHNWNDDWKHREDDDGGCSRSGVSGKGKGKGKGYTMQNNHRYENDDWSHDNKKCDPRTGSPTSSPTPVPKYYYPPTGGVSCFPLDSSTSSGYKHNKGQLVKSTINYEYKLETQDGYDSNKAVKNIESALAKFFKDNASDILDCDGYDNAHGSKRRNTRGLKNADGDEYSLALYAIDPTPEDEVASKNNQCENCYNVDGAMTIYTGDDSPCEEISILMHTIKTFVANDKTGGADGVENIDVKDVHSDGVNCKKDSGLASVETVEEGQAEDNGLGKGLGIGLVLIALLILSLLFMQRRRQRRLRELSEIEERAARYIDEINGSGDRYYPLNAIDVHQCTSLTCHSCGIGRGEPQFVKTDEAKLVRRGDMPWSLLEKDETERLQYPNDEIDVSLNSDEDQSTSEI